jgi:pyruvate/2-oxoglutarate dehydrogenase complex dihydrolipoamide dehydrogenase (E3) component
VALVDRDERSAAPACCGAASPPRRCCSPPPSWTPSTAPTSGASRPPASRLVGVVGFEDAIVDKLVKGVTGLVKLRGIDVIQRSARSSPDPPSRSTGRTIAATDVIVATGSRPKLLPGLEIGDHIITSDQALWLDRIPARPS